MVKAASPHHCPILDTVASCSRKPEDEAEERQNSAPRMISGVNDERVKMSSSPQSTSLEAATLKKGLLWQQRDRFFSRWKERYFILTRDYLACFKKGSKVGMSEMGSFLYKVSLVDVEGLQWVDKKRDGVIAIKVGQDGQLLLWIAQGLDDWMFALREAVNRSKGRREALRKSQTLMPQLSDGRLVRRHLLSLQHTLSDSHMERSLVHRETSHELQGQDTLGLLRSVMDRQPTPHAARRSQRMSVLTDIDLRGELGLTSPFDSHFPSWAALGPRLRCSAGSHGSLVTLSQSSSSSHLMKPSPRSLQVSPALSQRSLYAQHIFSSPEVVPNTDIKLPKSGVASANCDFSFIRPDSPMTCSTLGSHGLPTPSRRMEYHRSHSCTNHLLAHHSPGPPGADIIRPCSIYGQPSLTVEKSAFSSQPPDVIPVSVGGEAVGNHSAKRPVRPCFHSKSDSSFVVNRLACGSAPGDSCPQGDLTYR